MDELRTDAVNPDHQEKVADVKEKRSIINCHTHIFTGDHVPPWLAKTFLIWPLYYLLPLSMVVHLFRWWYQGPYTWQFKPWYKKTARNLNNVKSFLTKNYILIVIKWVAGLFLTIHGFFIIYAWLSKIFSTDTTKWITWIDSTGKWLTKYNLLWPINGLLWQVMIVLFVLLFIPSGRNLILFVTDKIWNYMGKLPGKQTKELIKRYLNIGRYAFYRQQSRIFGRLRAQYPQDTGFIVLPMDMEYMAAGRLKKENRYRQQIQELAAIKGNHPSIFFPFIFIDPRRIGSVLQEKNYLPGDKEYFDYTIKTDVNGNKSAELTDCFIKEFIEKGENSFSGFKIYPALGYYPFDEKLLPLWKYAADNGLPIMTHCIRGTIYYRGRKKGNWYQHQVFREYTGKDKASKAHFKELLLPNRKNEDFSVNFTHPLNYLCLLEETLLRKIIGKSADQKLKDLFGYKSENSPLTSDLKKLKICFGHFGGDDEWNSFFEKDRSLFSDDIMQNPGGIDFLHDENGTLSETKTEQVWKGADWYSIICSLMLQYDNIYADISYILHSPNILPLLKQTLQHKVLKNRVLYGTDFYVVRNHKSDKNMLADMMIGLDEEEFDLIARENPRSFLNLH